MKIVDSEGRYDNLTHMGDWFYVYLSSSWKGQITLHDIPKGWKVFRITIDKAEQPFDSKDGSVFFEIMENKVGQQLVVFVERTN